MLHEFVTLYRDDIIAATRARIRQRTWPSVTAAELENGVPLFLSQLSDTLRAEAGGDAVSERAIGDSATLHGADLVALGLNVSQVVHDYGDICQAVTELAVERRLPITTEEFHTLNRCLDDAIARAVTEHARVTAHETSSKELERLGQLAHEARNMLHSAMLAFHALKRGTVAINGSTGAVLGRGLMDLGELVDRTLAEVRLDARRHERRLVTVAALLSDFGAAGSLHAEYAHKRFELGARDTEVRVLVDPQLVASAVMNLISNGFKFTREGGMVKLCSRHDGTHVFIEVEDECGGIPESNGDPFQAFGERRGTNRTGLGLGLSIARKAIRAHGGDITIRNRPGIGCVFTITLPLAPADTPLTA
ncbi:MAG: HAMP domain-containing histidine kinase [Acidobacteriota bacterium]|nr:HAMP domain-containing histidine kinase [Acidobacteriota bacterium]